MSQIMSLLEELVDKQQHVIAKSHLNWLSLDHSRKDNWDHVFKYFLWSKNFCIVIMYL